MTSDMFLVIIWWSYILILGLIFLPVANKFFSNWFDKGYLFSKAVGIAVVSYISWLLSSSMVLPFKRSILFGIIIFTGVVIYFLFGKKFKYKEILVSNRKVFSAEEVMFFIILAFWAYVRGMQPDISGLEKYMDFGFINSILRSDFMPAKDMWYAGGNLNYYYFGHYVCAVLTKLTGIDSAVAYNLMLSTICSFMFSLTFSISANLVYHTDKKNYSKIIAAGLISASLLTFGGNLHGFIYGVVIPKAQAIGLYSGQKTSFYYPDSTRYIGYNPPTNDKTIHEFPIYSLVVSDLHGHVSNVPFVLTFIALLFSFIANRSEQKLDKYYGLFAVFLLGIFYMTNSWDYPIYLGAAGLAMLYKYFFVYNLNFKKSFSKALKNGISMVALSQIADLPFVLTFIAMTGGVGIVKAHSPIYQLLVLWGYQLFIAVVFFIFAVVWGKKNAFKGEEIHPKPKFKDKIQALFSSDAFTLILLIWAIFLLILPEVIYIRDIYGITYHRANTMFKFTYQAFMMFALVAGFCYIRVISGINKIFFKAVTSFILTVMIILPMVYPFFAVKGYYGSLSYSNYKGLNGLKFMETKYTDDYYIVRWLNENVSGQKVVLEASGKDFSNYNIISMATGLPTILGWSGHEWLWRNGNEGPDKRAADEKLIYESDDISATKEKLKYYNVSYIVIGNFEKEKYKDLRTNKLLSLGEVVIDLPDAMLIKLK